MVLPGMLHIAVVRSPVAHAKISNVDVSAAQQAPGVVAVFTGRDFAEEQGSIPCAWPVTPDMVNPGHPSVAVEEVNHVGEAVAVIVARSKTAAQDAVELVDVDYDQLPVVHGHGGGGRAGAAPLPRPPGVQRELPVRLRRRRGRHGRRHRPGLRRRRRRGQPAVRPAAADPGVHGAALGRRPAAGRQLHDVVLHPGAAHPPADAGDGHRHARAQAAGHRPRRRWRLRRQAAGHARGGAHPPGGQAAGQAGQVDRDPQRVADERPPRPRPDPVHRHRRRPRGQRQGPEGATSSPTWAPTCGWSARACRSSARSCTSASTSSRPTGSTARASSPTRCPPTPTAAPAGPRPRSRSSGSWTSWPSSWTWTRWSCAARTGSRPRSSRSPRRPGLEYDSGDYEQATQQALRAARLRRAARRAAAPAGVERPGPAGHRLLHVHRDVRAGAVPGARLARPTAPAAGRTRPSGCCPRARSRWSPARRRTARATRRRGASSSPTSSACRSRTSRCCTATPRSPPAGWTPTAPGRWSSAAPRW